MARRKGCREIAAELGLPVPDSPWLPAECCWSCHEDADEGYEDLIWLDDGSQVCCAILRAMEAAEPPPNDPAVT